MTSTTSPDCTALAAETNTALLLNDGYDAVADFINHERQHIDQPGD